MEKSVRIYINKMSVLLLLSLVVVGCGRVGRSRGAVVTTTIRFAETDYDFGKLRSDTLVHDFRFENTGKHPLVVNKLEASCHCVTAERPAQPVMPGRRGSIRVTYVREPGQQGHFFRSVAVYTNGSAQPVKLSVSGEN